MNAQIPPIPESRAKQTPARLARKVGPLFGVPWPEAPGGWQSWCCDYSRLTLAEVMRGAPRPAKDSEPGGYADRGVSDDELKGSSPIANATAARFGPDTKAAFVLTAANVLLEPVTDALCNALAEVPVDDPILLIGTYASCLLEVFRSEPLLILSAMQAEGVQRALSAVGAPFRVAGVTALALHEFGREDTSHSPANSPLSLDLVVRLSDTLCRRLTPAESNEPGADPSTEQAMVGNAHDRLCRLVSTFAKGTLLDASAGADDAALRILDGPDGRRADLFLMTISRIKRFIQGVSPHVLDPGDQSDPVELSRVRLDAITASSPVSAGGTPLAQRAALTVHRGLLSSMMATMGNSGEPARHRRALLMLRYADAVEETFSSRSTESPLERLYALAELIDHPAGQGEDPTSPQTASLRAARIQEAVPLAAELLRAAAHGEFSSGYICNRVDNLLVGLNQVRARQHAAPVPELPSAAELTRILEDLWKAYLPVLESFFAAGTSGYQGRLHNYAGFLVQAASTLEMRERGLALLRDEVLPSRRESYRANGRFGILRVSLQVSVRGYTRLARDIEDPDAKAEHLRTARALAEELLAGGDDVAELRANAGTSSSGYIMTLCLADCYLTSAEAAGAASSAERSQWTARAAEFLDACEPFVRGDEPSLRYRVLDFAQMSERLGRLTGSGVRAGNPS
ncbi:hypothetical protein [Streptacidiphilus carbonis]|uniref:hypothetical protein n=1 Tax=Streptacidiphilus carbonis TaxID=105422 RepID=UPI0013765C9E|nr:hypothetical protein [Streptacidiphilus carbonis]